jgi:hypothetical protein
MIGSLMREQTIHPLGFPMRITTNSAAVMTTVQAEYSSWTQLFDASPLELHIEVSGASGVAPQPAAFRTYRHLFAFAADEGNFAIGDRLKTTAAAWLTSEAAADAAYLRYHFLDAIAYHLTAAVYMTPVHAACIARGGRGVLLCGDSGAGKSTLAYAAARRGFTYVTDDASYIVRSRASDRLVVGNAHRMRLRPEAAQVFPELGRHAPSTRGNGKESIELWTRTLPAIDIRPSVAVDRIVFLDRKPRGAARLRAHSKSDALDWCRRVFYHWDPSVGTEQEATAASVIEASRVETLEYSEPEGAVDALDR